MIVITDKSEEIGHGALLPAVVLEATEL